MKSESINTGDRFVKWCKLFGREEPPQEFIDALNVSMDTGVKVLRDGLRNEPETYQQVNLSYRSFISGKGHGRV
jgi:hypothetical protein